MYLISAETNVGKTAFLTNLGLDILETNPEITLIYFSLDDDRIKIAYRFINILTELPYRVVKRGLQNMPVERKLIEEKRSYFLELLKDKKIFIPDLSEIQNINQVEKFIDAYSDKKLVVCIDGLYNLDVDTSGGIREENIQRANKVKVDCR
jgi:replicative DNA helicase